MNEISIGKYNITFYEVPDYNENSATVTGTNGRIRIKNITIMVI